MSRLTYIGVAVLVLVASAAVVSWSLGLGPTKSSQNNNQQKLSQEPPTFPIKPSDPSVKRAAVRYLFTGTVERVINFDNGLELVTDIKGNNIPKFNLNANTKISFLNGDQSSQASLSDLKAGQKVEINIGYGLKKKAWNDVFAVVILK